MGVRVPAETECSPETRARRCSSTCGRPSSWHGCIARSRSQLTHSVPGRRRDLSRRLRNVDWHPIKHTLTNKVRRKNSYFVPGQIIITLFGNIARERTLLGEILVKTRALNTFRASLFPSSRLPSPASAQPLPTMPDSPSREDPAEDKKDELEDNGGEPETAEVEASAESAQPAKRGRGRPRGSKNKKTIAAEAARAAGSSTAGGSSDPPVKRPRGRPRKRPAEDEAPSEPKPKRKRGRPPKNKPAEAPAEAEGDEGEPEAAAPSEPPKKKRGRPPKNASS
ncbi:uncharacterized protein C8Q71DRAFT_733763 [Rhodofomes roseus]|uniref:Uncharacterized protein n=1 Tax=Rhodofomes roseus TaxID=34475 RepID=A0ABQ8KVU0_9APHY|nr:uncharacterized protein C8Q71DRAFT_733763 [Rhodofomes roseus]KAH9842649.1 hypothetical protein C8Q71DRAFT_733763 [Rhodofomes roseus]